MIQELSCFHLNSYYTNVSVGGLPFWTTSIPGTVVVLYYYMSSLPPPPGTREQQAVLAFIFGRANTTGRDKIPGIFIRKNIYMACLLVWRRLYCKCLGGARFWEYSWERVRFFVYFVAKSVHVVLPSCLYDARGGKIQDFFTPYYCSRRQIVVTTRKLETSKAAEARLWPVLAPNWDQGYL